MTALVTRYAAFFGGALVLAGACNADPVHDGEVAALGPEPGGGSPGPDHRPGQPCVTCHGDSGPAHEQFSIAGTIFQSQSGALVPQNIATVTLRDTTGTVATIQTNEAGNFWIQAAQWVPTYPVHVESVVYSDISASMTTHIGRDGSCADCHSDPPGGELVGHIYLAPGDEPDGGFPGGGP